MKNLASLLAASLSILGLSSSASALTVCNIGDSQLAAVEPNWGPVTDCACGKIEAVMIGQTDGNRGTYVMISSNGWNGGGGSAWAVSQWLVSGQGTSWIYQKDVNGAYIKGNAGAGWGGGEFFAYGFDSEWLERYTLYCAQ